MLDQKLEDKANDLDATDPVKAKAIREGALFYARQRTQDLLTQMASLLHDKRVRWATTPTTRRSV